MKKYAIWLIVIFLIILLGFAAITTTLQPMESLMKPPRVEGENLAIQLAFEEKVGTDYILKQPISGNHRSAYNFIDLTGNKQNEVVVFYSKADNLGIVRMNVLNNVDGKWVSIADFQSVYNDIQEVDFADLNGDGNKEIIVGWTVFQDSYSKLLSIYEVYDNNSSVKIYPVYSDYYSMFKVADFDANAKDDVLTLKYAVAGNSTEYNGAVLSYSNNTMTERKTFSLDKSVNSVAAINIDYFNDGLTRIFIDGYKADGGMLTDCFLWDTTDDTLERAYVGGNSIASLTSRTSSVVCKDINSDGLIELPREEYLPNTSEDRMSSGSNNLGMSVISWFWFNDNDTEFIEQHMILNQYGYSFRFNRHMSGNVSVENNTQKGLLTFYSIKNENGSIVKDEPLFSIMTLTELDLEAISEISFYYYLVGQNKDKYYYCRVYDAAEDYAINKKEIKNRMILG
jgi:hypothetical protein